MGDKNNWLSRFHDELSVITDAVFHLHAKANAFREVGNSGFAEELDYWAYTIDNAARSMQHTISGHIDDEYRASSTIFHDTFAAILEQALKAGE